MPFKDPMNGDFGIDYSAPDTEAIKKKSAGNKAVFDNYGGKASDFYKKVTGQGGGGGGGDDGSTLDPSGIPEIPTPATPAPVPAMAPAQATVGSPYAASTVAAPAMFTPASVNLPTEGAVPGQVHLTNPNGPTVAQIGFNPATGYAPNAVANQNALMAQLLAQSQGQGPSVAGQMLQQGQENNINAVMAQLASARGGANPLLQRQAMNAGVDIQAQTARDAATARLQEQLAAQGLLGQVSNAAANQGLAERGQNIGLATNQAQLAQSANLAGYEGQTKADLANAQFQHDVNVLKYKAGVDASMKNSDFAQQALMGKFGADVQAAMQNSANEQSTNMAAYSAQTQADLLNAKNQQDANTANLQAASQYNDLVMKYASLGMDAKKSQLLAAIELKRIQAAKYTADQQRKGQLAGGVLTAGGGILGAGAAEWMKDAPVEDTSDAVG